MGKNLKKVASYLDEIGACREAIGYDQEQEGLAHEQEVAQSDNWGNDQRDPIGRAAIQNRKNRLAKKLERISRELEAIGKMEEQYATGVEEMLDDENGEDYEEDFDSQDDGNEESGKDAMNVEMGEWLDSGKEATHPIQHDPNKDDPAAFAPSTMGDEWISIGPAKFDDQRNQIGHA